MSEYNRFTTAKGNLLLNIAPPSEYNQTTNYHSTNHASITNQNYNPNTTIGAKPHQIDQAKLKSSNGGSGYPSEPKVLRESRENKTNSGYFKDGRQNREEGVIDQNVEIKEGSNATKCCFPGFWLLILALAVVAAATLLIIFWKKGIFEHSVDKNTSKSVNKDEENFSELQLNSNSTYTLSPTTEPQQIEPIEISPIPIKPNESLLEDEGSKTSFQFPLEENEISAVKGEIGANEVKNIPVVENEYETSYMIPKIVNHRHFLRRNVMH